MEKMTTKEALRIINQKDDLGISIPFAIRGRRFSVTSKSGGKEYFYRTAHKAYSQKKTKEQKIISDLVNGNGNGKQKTKRDPNHLENRTLNIEVFKNGKRAIETIHIDFITELNYKKVI